MFFSINVAFANVIHDETISAQEQEQPKSQNGINGQSGQLEDSKQEKTIELDAVENEDSEVDSVQDDSVSKYNFIFYFLYKFKYEEEV